MPGPSELSEEMRVLRRQKEALEAPGLHMWGPICGRGICHFLGMRQDRTTSQRAEGTERISIAQWSAMEQALVLRFSKQGSVWNFKERCPK
jgi:hypothetical protein